MLAIFILFIYSKQIPIKSLELNISCDEYKNVKY